MAKLAARAQILRITGAWVIPASMVAPTPWTYAALLAAMFSIQSGASVAKGLFAALGPIGVTALRLLFAAAILWLVARPWRRWPDKATWRSIVLYGLALACMNTTFYLALERIPLGVAVALEFSGPLGLALCASRRAVDALWAVLAGFGILLLTPLYQGAALDPLGVFYALIAGFFWACYIVFGQRGGRDGQLRCACLGISVGAVALLPAGLLMHGQSLLDVSLWPAAIKVALLSSALPYSLEMLAMTRMSAHAFGILMSMEPAIGALCGHVFLREYLRPAQLGAIACVITACLGNALTRARQAQLKES